MNTPASPRTLTQSNRRLLLLSAISILLPILTFYGLLFKNALNIPYWDDYFGVLQYLENYSHLHGTAKLLSILTTQHNEYKTIFANALIAMQYEVFGHPNFVVLSWLGNAFVLVLLWLLWRQFLREDGEATPRRLMFFIPVVCFLFQLQYSETLDWASPGLQNIPVLIFALAAIEQLTRSRTQSFLAANLFMILAIAASGNGFALLPVGMLMLWQQKSYRRLAVWVAVAGLCAAGYFYHYDFHSSQQVQHGSVLSSAHYINPIFTLSFMGAGLGYVSPRFRFVSVVVGTVLCGIFWLMIRRRYDRRNPAVFYLAIFLILTAIAVSGIRSKLGLSASLAYRYKIYSDLLFISAYIFLFEVYARGKPRARVFYPVALVCSVLFCLFFNYWGKLFLASRRIDLLQGAAIYESSHHQRGPVRLVGREDLPEVIQLNQRVHSVMEESETTGLYRFP